jgi:hypothetical protein
MTVEIVRRERRWTSAGAGSLHPVAIPKKLVTFQVMPRTLGTDMRGYGTMKDAQQTLRHASIKTTAEIHMQEIQASVRSAINSGAREIFRRQEPSQLENPVSHQRKHIALPRCKAQPECLDLVRMQIKGNRIRLAL